MCVLAILLSFYYLLNRYFCFFQQRREWVGLLETHPDMFWKAAAFEKVDEELHQIMINIHKNSWDAAKKYGHEGNLVVGANIAGFLKVADSMLDQGIV